MLCSNSQHKTNNARCFIPIMLSLYSVVQVSTHHKPGFMIASATHFYAQDNLLIHSTSLLILNVRKVSRTVQYCSWFLDYLMLKPIMPALCWHAETAYHAQSNANILCLNCPYLSGPTVQLHTQQSHSMQAGSLLLYWVAPYRNIAFLGVRYLEQMCVNQNQKIAFLALNYRARTPRSASALIQYLRLVGSIVLVDCIAQRQYRHNVQSVDDHYLSYQGMYTVTNSHVHMHGPISRCGRQASIELQYL